MTGPRPRKTGTTLPDQAVAGLAELLTAIDRFLHTAHASAGLAAYLRSHESQLPEHDASTLIDWLSFTARAFRDLAAIDNDGGQHPQERRQ